MINWIEKNKAALGIAVLIVAASVWYTLAHDPSTAQAISQRDVDQMAARCNAELLNRQGLSKETCFSKEFVVMAEKRGSEFSFALLTKLQERDPELRGCHLIAHGIGTGAYQRDPANWQNEIRTVNSSCGYGALHGIIEGYLGDQPDHTLNKEVLPTICGDRPRADCNHIVGHLTLVETQGDVPQAINLCRALEDRADQYRFCLTGVFMEYQTALNLIEHGYAPQTWLNWPARVPELEKMCRSYSGLPGIACWEEIVHAALVKFNNDPAKIFAFCSTSQIPEGARLCRRHSLGIMAAAHNFELEPMKPACAIPQRNDPHFAQDCYGGLVSSLLSTIPSAVPQAQAFCASVPAQFQSSCQQSIENSIRGNSPARLD